jgi:hypothetical protein
MELSELRSKLVSNYKAELEYVLKLKDTENIQFLESEVWDFKGSYNNNVMIPIDEVIEELSTRLDKLESLTEMTMEEVQGYNY